MRTSEQINELATALAIAQGEIENAKADAKNPHFKSSYADLTSVRNAIQKPLSKNGLSITQLPETIDGKHVLTSRLMHKSGQWIEGGIELLIDKPTMQGMGSATTYAKRYALTALTGLAEEDDDGNSASQFPKQSSPAVKPAAAANPSPVNATLSTQSQPNPNLATEAQRKLVWAKLKNELQMHDDGAREFIRLTAGVDSAKDMTKEHVQILLKAIDELKIDKPEPGWEG